MALSLKKPVAEPPLVPDLQDDPEFRPATDLLATLEAKWRSLTDLVAMLELERYLERRPVDKKSTTSLAEHTRLRWLRAKVAVNAAFKPIAATGEPPEITDALALIAGKPVWSAPSIPEQLRLAREGLQVVEVAIRVQNEIVTEIRERKCEELSRRLATHVDALVLAAYRAAQQLIRDTAAVRDVNAAVVKAGYGPLRSDIAPAPLLRGAMLLGSEIDWNSDISVMRRALEHRGLLG